LKAPVVPPVYNNQKQQVRSKLTPFSTTHEDPISGATFCAVDVETSGLRMTSRVVEVGAVKFNLSGERYEFQSLVNPCELISRGATEIHGITDEMVASAPRAPDVMPALLNFMRGCVFIAHNATFDVRMIGDELARMRAEAPAQPVVCTVRLARKRIQGPPNYRLGTLVEHLGIDILALHSALPDAHAAREVFLEGLRGLPPETRVADLPGFLGPFDSIAPPSVEDLDPTGDIEELESIARSRLTIEMDYEPSSARGPVVVTPLYVFAGGEHRYMKAYCHRDGIHKTYRLDRIIDFRRV
jgi:DNA polymerase III epsilon subunit family exonuclease